MAPAAPQNYEMQKYLGGTGFGFFLCFVLAIHGNNWVQDLKWFGGDRVGEFGSRIDWQGMCGFLLTALCLPLTFCFGGAFSLAVFKYPTIVGKAGKMLVLTGCEAVFVFLACAAWDSNLGLASDVLPCGIFWCYDAKTNDTQARNFEFNYRVALGTCLFFPSLLLCAFIFLLLMRVGMDFPVARAVTGLSGGASSSQHAASGGGGGPGGYDADDKRAISRELGYGIHEGLLSGEPRFVGDAICPKPKEGRVVNARGLGQGTALLRSALLMGLIVCLFLATGVVPHNWESFTRNVLITYGAKKFALLPEWGDATLKTVEVTTDGGLVLHLFPDCFVFYGLCAFLVIVGTLAKAFPKAVGAKLRERVLVLDDRPPAKWWWAWVAPPPLSVSKGGLLAAAAFAAAMVLHVRYWAHDHKYHRGEDRSHAEYAARAMGQTANFLMGLLLLPVTKNSVLTSVFGVAWEQVIFVHVLLGQVVLVVVALHMVLWWRVFDNEAAFPMDVLQVPMWFPANSNCGRVDPNDRAASRACFEAWHHDIADDDTGPVHTPDSDNFTIQMATITSCAMFVCMGWFARFSARRANYELFHYLHHVFLAVIVTALLHAASSWYYLTGGLVLWGADRCLRALNRSRRWALLSVEPCPDGVTRLDLAPLDDWLGRGTPFEFSCGQYIYLNIPSLGPHEWHPFTISSAPADGAVTCHIKAAPGPKEDSFTGKLHLLAQAFDAKRRSGLVSLGADEPVDQLLRGPDGKGLPGTPGRDVAGSQGGGGGFGDTMVVSVDGPYGEWLDVDAHDELLLLAGGIGFTPIHSIARQVRAKMAAGACGCQRLHVMLAVQRRSALDPFLATLQALVDDDLDGRCRLTVFVDNEPGVSPIEPEGGHFYNGVPFQVGKLNCVPFIRELGAKKQLFASHVFVCGPPGLAATADAACLEHGVSFHKEVFAF